MVCRDHGWLHGSHNDAIAEATCVSRRWFRRRREPLTNSTEFAQANTAAPEGAYAVAIPAPKLAQKESRHDDDSRRRLRCSYGSKYFSVPDLKGQRPRRTIGKVEVAELKEKDGSTKRKRILYLEGEDKPLVLNKTNAVKLAMAFGKESSEWINARVELYSEMTSLGKEGVRLTPLRTVTKAAPAQRSRRSRL